MSTLLNGQLGLKKEVDFGTPVVVDAFYEPNTQPSIELTTVPVKSTGLRSGQRAVYGDRYSIVARDVAGDFETDLYTRGMGKLVEAAMTAAGTSTIIGAGPGYQQLFTQGTADFLNSYTIQVGVPFLGGAVQPHTFNGVMCSGFELSGAIDDIPKLTTSWVGRDMLTATALATASYPVQVPFTFNEATIGLGGTLVVPTTTALGSGATANADITGFTVKYENNFDGGGRNFGSTGALTRKKARGMPMLSGTLEVEYVSNTLRDAFLNNTSLALSITYTDTAAITGVVFPAFQIAIPAIKLKGKLPVQGANGDVPMQSIEWEMVDDRVASHPFYVVIVTAETAI